MTGPDGADVGSAATPFKTLEKLGARLPPRGNADLEEGPGLGAPGQPSSETSMSQSTTLTCASCSLAPASSAAW